MLSEPATRQVLEPLRSSNDAPHIDASLARGIRRAYFRELNLQWGTFVTRMKQAPQRNTGLGRAIDTDKQLRERCQQLEKMLGPLIPCASAVVRANSRSGAFFLGLLPDEVPTAVRAETKTRLMALTLLRPGRYMPFEVSVWVSGHAVDRVIQRSHMLDLPIKQCEIQAINAEFADALPLACIAAKILAKVDTEQGAARAAEVNVLLPAAHGVFLASWMPDEDHLIVKTYVDGAKLNGAQREALRELALVTDAELSAHVFSAITQGWMKAEVPQLEQRLLDAWQHYGWRFEEDRLHPGMSDQAWEGHG